MSEGRLIKNKLRIVRQVGRGGMGFVYEAYHEGLRVTRALKQIVGDLQDNPDIERRFLHEAQMMARLEHPHIVRVFDIDQEPGFGTYLLMEFIRGRDLGDVLRQEGRFSYAETLRIGIAVASALDCAHRAGLVHRDIKPANILIEDDTGRPVVTDFGIAKELEEANDESFTRTGSFVGTYRYSSREQIRSEKGVPIDGRADVYSLGVVLYEIYAGKKYLAGMPELKIAGCVGYQDDWVPILDYPEDPPPLFKALIDECLVPDRDRRIQSASDLVRRLEECRALDGQGDGPTPASHAEVAAVVPADPSEEPTSTSFEPRIPSSSDAAASRSAWSALLQTLRGAVDDHAGQFERLLTGLIELDQPRDDFRQLDDVSQILHRVEVAESAGQYQDAASHLQDLSDRIQQLNAHIEQALREAIRRDADELTQAWGELTTDVSGPLPGESTRSFEQLLEAISDARDAGDWTRGRRELLEARTRLDDVRRVAQATAAEKRTAADAERSSEMQEGPSTRVGAAASGPAPSSGALDAEARTADEANPAQPLNSEDVTRLALLPPASIGIPPTGEAGGQPSVSPDATSFLGGSGGPGAHLPVALVLTRSPKPSQIGIRKPIETTPFTIGRSAESSLQLDDVEISREHARIDCADGVYTICDLASRNGIYLNGRRVLPASPEPLFFKDEILLATGTVVTFVADLPSLPALKGQTVGKFDLEELMHESDRATTYAARDRSLRRRIAIKIFSPALEHFPREVRDLHRRAEATAQLRHPHICDIMESGQLRIDGVGRDVTFFAMPLLQGGSLQDKLRTSPLPPVESVLEWVHQLADALDYAHSEQVIHGGLKPSCILFDARDHPYVTDFSVVRQGDDGSRKPVIGAWPYLAPEQWDGDLPSAASDQYALGALAYLMITGSRPFEEQTNPEMRRRNYLLGPLNVHEEASRNGRNGVPSTVSTVLRKALAVDPASRYGSIVEFSRELRRAFSGKTRRSSAEPQVFLSYRRESSAGWATLFADRLESKHAIRAFIDTERRDAAGPFPRKISNAIVDADVFVCFVDDRTFDSTWVLNEIQIAFQNGKPMVPVFHEGFHPPSVGDRTEPHVHALLEFDAVHLFDRLNVYVDRTIADLAERVRRTVTTSDGSEP